MTRTTSKLLIAFALLAVCAFAQAPRPGIDYPSPIPVPFIGYTTGYSNPALCYPGLSPLFFNQTTGAFYGCTSRNTWTAPSITGAVTGTTGTFSSTVTTTSPRPALVGTSMIGSAAAPWLKAYLGTAATNNFVLTPASTSAARIITMADPGGAATLAYTNSTSAQTITSTTIFGDSTAPTKTLAFSLSGATAGYASTLTFAQTAARTITFPDASITVSGAVSQDCASSASCAATNTSSTLKVVRGTGLLVTGTPSVFAVTGMSPAFTSASTYTCTAQDVTTIANNIGVLAAGYVSASAVTFTGPASNTDTFRYICVGY